MTGDSRSFSQRHGYRAPEKEISIREDAPADFREAIVALANRYLDPHNMRLGACSILLKKPDSNNWTAYPNVFDEVHDLVLSCHWHRVYDIAEDFYDRIKMEDHSYADEFQSRLNEFLIENGIGWAMDNGRFVARGSEAFSAVPNEAINLLRKAGCNTAANEIHEALQALSRRPAPDLTGSIQHAMAALECVARNVTGQPTKTFGKLVADHRDKLNLPRPLDQALEKMWGYASETGRHLVEGREPRFEDAELVVTVAAGVATYLSRFQLASAEDGLS